MPKSRFTRRKRSAGAKRTARARAASARVVKKLKGRRRPFRRVMVKNIQGRKKAAIESVVRKVLNKQREKRAVKIRAIATPVTVTLTPTCDSVYAIGRSGIPAGVAPPIDDNPLLTSWTTAQQLAYEGTDSNYIHREGAAIRITKLEQAGRLNITWGSRTGDIATALKERVHHHQLVIQFREKSSADLFTQNTTSGNVFRRIVYGLVMTTNKPTMTSVETKTADTLLSDNVYTGVNYSRAMQRPLNEEVIAPGDTYNWADVKLDFRVLLHKKRTYYRPRQHPSTSVPAHMPGGVYPSTWTNAPPASSVVAAVGETDSDAWMESPSLAAIASEHDYSHAMLFKGGKLIKYEDAADMAEGSPTTGMKPMLSVHWFKSENNGAAAGNITVDWCYDAKSVYWSDL